MGSIIRCSLRQSAIPGFGILMNDITKFLRVSSGMSDERAISISTRNSGFKELSN